MPKDCLVEILSTLGHIKAFEENTYKCEDKRDFSLQYTGRFSRGSGPIKSQQEISMEVFGDRVRTPSFVGEGQAAVLCGSFDHSQAICPDPVCVIAMPEGTQLRTAPKSGNNKPGSRPSARGQTQGKPSSAC